MTLIPSARPVPDPERPNAFTPSPLSLKLLTTRKTNLSDPATDRVYDGGRWKILVVCSDQRYLEMDNGTFFSTGNHPVETLLPLIHLTAAGFDFRVATPSGLPTAFEEWAMPTEDEAVVAFRARHSAAFEAPLPLAEVAAGLHAGSDYLAVFIPGGHGALIDLPESPAVQAVLDWAAAEDRFVISICHGPAALLSLGDDSPWLGRRICAFSDFVDGQTPRMGYMPGDLRWKMGEALSAKGLTITNRLISGATESDGKLLTGDSPLASDALGRLAAKALLDAALGTAD